MNDPRTTLFRIFNEIGIISQLGTAVLARRLPDGLHPSQFTLLGNLARLGDGKTPADLARAFQVPKPSMTNTLMQLEKRGLIVMRIHPDDMRKKQIFLTDAGRNLYLQIIGEMQEPISRLADDIEGLEDILPVLEQLRQKMDNNRDM
ncbi:transcriptional regulator, MarR family [Sulfitobacter marinus]|uniref:Transcriptional regulator, MarR family n=1 Tax=Sulfitobacter marinus TaxID=394264 RepID=A0A1I6T283_9RHOB|nr:MarR family transcriptional regulator [Sulfitobacter marinus]SFS83362.1 transcriptional regulator, MarR family [Sulfitobacter marinus]